MENHISASQILMFLKCPKQYEFRYIDGIKSPPKGSMTRGSAFHHATGKNYEQKIESMQDLRVNDVEDIFSTEWERLKPDTEFLPDEKPEKLKDDGVRMIDMYHGTVANIIQPIAVERKIEVEVNGQSLVGYIDLETKDCLHETKTSGKTPSEVMPAHLLQMAVYSLDTKAKKFQADYVIPLTKEVKIQSFTKSLEDLPVARLHKYIAAFSDALIRGSFPPTDPGNWACSEKWCGYWNRCEYGGKK